MCADKRGLDEVDAALRMPVCNPKPEYIISRKTTFIEKTSVSYVREKER